MKKTMFLMCAAALILVSAGCCNDRQNQYCSRSWNPFRGRSCQQQVCYPVADTPVVDDCFSCGSCGTTVAAPSTGCSSCSAGSSAPVVEPAPL